MHSASAGFLAGLSRLFNTSEGYSSREPELSSTVIWAEKSAGLQTTGNCAERRCWRASVAHTPNSRVRRTVVCVGIGEMRRVGEVGRIRSELQGEPFGQFELTSQTQVHAEVTRTAEFIAVGVSQVSVRVASNKRRCEGAWVEVFATQVAQGADAVAVGLSIQNMERSDKVACLTGSDRVQRPRAGDTKRQTSEIVDQWTNLPPTQNRVADTCLCPPLSLAKR